MCIRDRYRIIPDSRRVETEVDIRKVRAAVLAHLFYEDQVEYSKRYLDRLPDGIDCIILSAKEEILAQFPYDRYIKIKKENKGRDISALLVAAREAIFQYQYICFVHDKREKSPDDREFVELWRKNLWDNMLQSPEYVANLIDIFERESRIGLLVPLPPHQGDNGVWLKGNWGGTFGLVRNLAKLLGLAVEICYDAPPVTYSTVFWARTKILRKLYSREWTYSDFPDEPMRDYGELNHAVERILQYVAEDAGYDTTVALSSTFAAAFILQLKEEADRMWERAGSVFGIRNYRDIDVYGQRAETIRQFQKAHPDLYLYGAGSAGKDCLRMCTLLGIVPAGILVTDRKDAPDEIEGIRILSVSELEISDRTGILITVYETDYQNAIISSLDRMGFYAYIVY